MLFFVFCSFHQNTLASSVGILIDLPQNAPLPSATDLATSCIPWFVLVWLVFVEFDSLLVYDVHSSLDCITVLDSLITIRWYWMVKVCLDCRIRTKVTIFHLYITTVSCPICRDRQRIDTPCPRMYVGSFASFSFHCLPLPLGDAPFSKTKPGPTDSF